MMDIACTLSWITVGRLTHSVTVFDVGISSLVKKVFHYTDTISLSCHMQRSHLMERNYNVKFIYKLPVHFGNDYVRTNTKEQ